MAGRAALAEPRLAFETVNGVTGLVWDVTGENRGYETVSNSGDLPQALYGPGDAEPAGDRRHWP